MQRNPQLVLRVKEIFGLIYIFELVVILSRQLPVQTKDP
jgi:hypothetical protein